MDWLSEKLKDLEDCPKYLFKQKVSNIIKSVKSKLKKEENLKNPANEFKSITRFEAIDHRKNGNGRVLSVWDINIEVSIQDSGKTMKVFITDKK